MTLLTLDLNNPNDFVDNYIEILNAMDMDERTDFSRVFCHYLQDKITLICRDACLEGNYNCETLELVRRTSHLGRDMMDGLFMAMEDSGCEEELEEIDKIAVQMITKYLQVFPAMRPCINKMIHASVNVAIHEKFYDGYDEPIINDEPAAELVITIVDESIESSRSHPADATVSD